MTPYLKVGALIGALLGATVLLDGCILPPPAPVYSAPRPFYYAPAPTYFALPVYAEPAPAVTFDFGFNRWGGRHGR